MSPFTIEPLGQSHPPGILNSMADPIATQGREYLFFPPTGVFLLSYMRCMSDFL